MYFVFLLCFLCVLIIPCSTSATSEVVKIVCDGETECTVVPEQPVLFSDALFVPGTTISKEVVFENTHDSYGCSLSVGTHPTPDYPTELAKVVLLSVYQPTYPQQLIPPVSLSTLFTRTTTPVVVVNPNTTAHTTWQILFPTNAGNQYQNTTTSFSFQFVTECAPHFRAPTPPPLPSQTPSPAPTATPQCTLPPPPQGVSFSWKDKKLRISWNRGSRASAHLISLRSLQTQKQFTNVVIEHTSHWDVSGLSNTESYEVAVQARTTCGTSEAVKLSIPAIENKTKKTTTAPTQQPSQSGLVLGETTSSPVPTTTTTGSVSSKKTMLLVFYILFCASALLWFFIFLFRRKKHTKTPQD